MALGHLDPAGTNLRIYLVADLVRAEAPRHVARFPNGESRPHGVNSLHKILFHHHAGSVEHTGAGQTVRRRGREVPAKLPSGLPRAIQHTADIVGRTGAGDGRYGYHYDIPYYEEIVDTRRVLYQTVEPENIGYHTGSYNANTISVSLMGCNRSPSYPFGRITSSGEPAQPSWGRPSQYQLQVLEELLPYLRGEFKIHKCHVQGHFMHGKAACPGYDAERLAMAIQDEDRRFSYPVRLAGAGGAPLLAVGTCDTAAAREYLNNTRTNRLGGDWPYGRRQLAHNGVHLFPAARAPLYCVHDGWILAARLRGYLENFGSTSFILIQHKDPGLRKKPARNSVWKPAGSRGEQRIRHLTYYSLYMHVLPAADPGVEPFRGPAQDLAEVPWLELLRTRDNAAYTRLTTTDTVEVFGDLALPVSTGEIIGRAGMHNPFARHPGGSRGVPPDPVPVLHFEMFSLENLVELFDPDDGMHDGWTVGDTVNSPLVTYVRRGRRVTNRRYSDNVPEDTQVLIDDFFAGDAGGPSDDPGQAPQTDASVSNALSKVIFQRKSEWYVRWDRVPRALRTNWGLGTPAAFQQFRQDYVDQIQWMRRFLLNQAGDSAATQGDKRTRRRQLRKFGLVPSGAWPYLSISRNVFFYHPIRLLNWLNGLERAVDDTTPDGAAPRPRAYERLGSLAETPQHFFGDRTGGDSVRVAANAAAGATQLVLRPYRARDVYHINDYFEVPLEDFMVRNAIIHYWNGRNRGNDYRVTAVGALDEATGNRTVEIEPALHQRARRNERVQIRQHHMPYGWHWNATFAWDQDIT